MDCYGRSFVVADHAADHIATYDFTDTHEALAKRDSLSDIQPMPMAREAIEAQVLKWPAARRVDLAEKLLASVDDFASPELRTAWDTEIEQRMAEIREERAEGIPAAQVMAEARKQLHEARRLSSPRGSRTPRLR